MEPTTWRQPTGTFCKRGHPQFIEVRMVEVHGVKQNQGQLLSSVVSGAQRVQARRATLSGPRV